jgi:hypothetical protein
VLPGVVVTITGCPNCGSARLYRSRRRHPFERTLAALGATMRRCHDCNRRYASFGQSMMGVRDLWGVSRKVGLALTMAIAVVFIMAAILWFSHARSVPTSDTGCLMPVPRFISALLFRV